MSENLLKLIEGNFELVRQRVSVKSRLVRAYEALSLHVDQVGDSHAWESISKAKRNILPERVLEILSLDTGTGEFTWTCGQREGLQAGHACTARGKQYRRIRADGELIMAHVLVWLVTYREWPNHEIDHINGNGLDNRPENLAKSNRLRNNSNTGQRSDSAPFRAVYRNGKTWEARVKYANSAFAVRGFDTSEGAVAGRDLLESLLGRGVSHGKQVEGKCAAAPVYMKEKFGV